MRYYTKYWYELVQETGFAGVFKKIPDKIYTSKEIDALYQRELRKMIREEKRSYNSKLFFLFEAKDIDVEMFDSAEAMDLFEECYKNELKTCKKNFPSWMVKEVDNRLIALGYLPETAYIRYKKEIADKKKELEKINCDAKKELSKQSIPQEIAEALFLHDASLLSLRKAGKDMVMIVCKDGLWPDDNTPYRRVCFKNAMLMEKDANIVVRKQIYEDIYYSNITYLYHEIYKMTDSYEVHMMFYTLKGLGYVTLQCSDILYEDGIEL